MNSYIKLGLKTLVFILCLVILDCFGGRLLEWIQVKSQSKWPESLSFKTSYMVDKVNADIVIVGSSIASHHYIPKMIKDSTGLTAYNCAMDGHFFLYQNELINLMLERYQPKVIIWEIGEHFLSTRKDLEYQSINDLYPYYSHKHAKELIDGKDKYQKYRMLSMLYRCNSTIQTPFYHMMKNSCFEQGYVPIETTGYVYPTLYTKVEDDPIDSLKLDVLRETIEKCKDNGVKLIFTSSPRYASANTLDVSDYHCFLDLIDELQTPYINHFTLFNNDSTLFKDVSHMNDDGAHEYMKVFIPEFKATICEK